MSDEIKIDSGVLSIESQMLRIRYGQWSKEDTARVSKMSTGLKEFQSDFANEMQQKVDGGLKNSVSALLTDLNTYQHCLSIAGSVVQEVDAGIASTYGR
jgi:hypothetical protein